MPRVKLFENSAKKIVYNALGLPYQGIFINENSDIELAISELSETKTYVVKVDQGVKKRFKNGLVKLDILKKDIKNSILLLKEKGYDSFLIEEYIAHNNSAESYLAIERERGGILIYVSKKGGVDIEDNSNAIDKFFVDENSAKKLSASLGLSEKVFEKIIKTFDDLYFSFLEINPLVIQGDSIYFLDMALQVDDAGKFFVNNSWNDEDIVKDIHRSEEEQIIKHLKQKSQAAFSLAEINKDGSIFLLLSGGGASIVIADEVFNLGKANELVNYGEYSGNPNEEETYLYTKQIISLIIKSKAPNKVLIIGGGVANFTDIRTTFKGVIRALDEQKEVLSKMNIKVYVRRGGPGQKEGLENMEKFLNNSGLMGGVFGPTLPLQKIVELAIKTI